MDTACEGKAEYNKGFFNIKMFNEDKSEEIVDFVSEYNKHRFIDYPENLIKDRCGKIYLNGNLSFKRVEMNLESQYYDMNFARQFPQGRYIIQVSFYSQEYALLDQVDVPIEIIGYEDINENYCAQYWDNKYNKARYPDKSGSSDSCYALLAGTKKDINICNNIVDDRGAFRQECYDGLVKDFGQSCEDIINKDYRRQCKNTLLVYAIERPLEMFVDSSNLFFEKNLAGINIKRFFPFVIAFGFIFYVAVIFRHRGRHYLFEVLKRYFISALVCMIALILIAGPNMLLRYSFAITQMCDLLAEFDIERTGQLAK
jgi:hypothetical protein